MANDGKLCLTVVTTSTSVPRDSLVSALILGPRTGKAKGPAIAPRRVEHCCHHEVWALRTGSANSVCTLSRIPLRQPAGQPPYTAELTKPSMCRWPAAMSKHPNEHWRTLHVQMAGRSVTQHEPCRTKCEWHVPNWIPQLPELWQSPKNPLTERWHCAMPVPPRLAAPSGNRCGWRVPG